MSETVRIDAPERSASVRLTDGRLLARHEWGPATGRPVVFCTGAATSGRLGFGHEALAPLGIRLVAVDRPGLGGSSPDPDGDLATWARDVGELAGGQGWSGALAVGFSQGAPFALALAAAGVVDRCAVVSGQDDLASMRPRLGPDVAALVDRALDDPARLVEEVASTMTARAFLAMVHGHSGARDRALYTQPDFAAAFAAAVEDAFAHGAGGYARHLVTALRAWPFDLEALGGRVDLWYGQEDQSPVHSPDHGATLARRLGHARRVVLPGEGGSVLWTRGGDILERLLDP